MTIENKTEKTKLLNYFGNANKKEGKIAAWIKTIN